MMNFEIWVDGKVYGQTETLKEAVEMVEKANGNHCIILNLDNLFERHYYKVTLAE